jgi:hypothetical protein
MRILKQEEKIFVFQPKSLEQPWSGLNSYKKIIALKLLQSCIMKLFNKDKGGKI